MRTSISPMPNVGPSTRKITQQGSSRSQFSVLDDDSQPPKNIFEAAERGITSYVTRQVERTLDFDINQRDKYNRTALHWAAEMGHSETLEALLDFNSDVAAQECNGRTAIHLAARNCNADIIKTLLEAVEDAAKKKMLVNQTDNFGITPVYLTMQKGDEGKDSFQLLMSNGGKFNDMTQAAPPAAMAFAGVNGASV